MLPRSPATTFANIAAALLVGTVSLSAQNHCSPFSKWGMRRLSWSAGSTVTVGSLDGCSSAIALTFAHDATNGVAITQIGHAAAGSTARSPASTTPRCHQPASPPRCGRPFCRPVGSSTPSELSPANATNLCVWVDSRRAPRRAIFSWSGCCIPGVTAKSFFWFELHVKVSPFTPYRASFDVRMARVQNTNGSTPFTIDEVHAPIVHTLQPGDSQLARILVPSALNIPLPSANLSMRTWQLFNLAASLEHPARGQQMQFSALYAGDTTEIPDGNDVVSPHRKVLYFATEDNRGHFKFFNHSVVTGASGVSYRWNPVHYPTYGPTPWLNYYISPYSSVICALQAKSSAYWYDVAEHYRTFVRFRMGLTPMRSRFYRGNKDVVGDSVVVATSTLPIVHGDLGDVFSSFVDMGAHKQAVFTDPTTGNASPMFVEWQKWLKSGPGAPEDPIAPGLNPIPFDQTQSVVPKQPTASAQAEFVRGRGLGQNISVYTVPLLMNTTDWPSFDQGWLLRDRLGNLLPEEDGFVIDYGAEGVVDWLANVFYKNILDNSPGLGGVFFDTVGGRGSYLRYPQPGQPLFNLKYHGGTRYVKGGKRLFDAVRARIAASTPGSRHPDAPFIPTEAVQEFYAGRYDAAQHGLKPLPLQAQLSTFIDQLTSPGSTPPPVGASTGNPPLWNAVYHEYSRAEALGMMLSTRAVSVLLGGGQPADFASGRFGLTWDEWGNYNRMVHATMFIQGMKSSLFSYFYDFKDFSLLVDNAGTIGVRNPAIPQQGQLLAFLQRMHHATGRQCEAGQFLADGMMERPLEMPPFSLAGYDPTVVTTTVNPGVLAMQRTDPLPGVNQHFYEDPFTQFPYPMANVLHSVWRSSPYSRTLGLVFVNWTDQPAAWTGTFNPRLYAGFGDKFEVLGLRPDGGGVTGYQVGTGNGETTFHWGPAAGTLQLQHHGGGGPGPMPPRSVQVFLIRPRR